MNIQPPVRWRWYFDHTRGRRGVILGFSPATQIEAKDPFERLEPDHTIELEAIDSLVECLREVGLMHPTSKRESDDLRIIHRLLDIVEGVKK